MEAIDRSAKQSKRSSAAFFLRSARVRSMMAVLSPSAPTTGSLFFSSSLFSSFSSFCLGEAARVTYALYISSLSPRSLACWSTGM